MNPDATIERLGSGDGERLRAIRIRALADAPDAFGATLEEATARPLAPDARRGGVGSSPVDTVVGWARGQGLGRVIEVGTLPPPRERVREIQLVLKL